VPVPEVDVGRVERLAIGTSSRFIFTSRLRVAQRNTLDMPMSDSTPTRHGIRPIGGGSYRARRRDSEGER